MNQTLGPSDEILQLKMLELGKSNVWRKKPRQINGRKAYFYDFFSRFSFCFKGVKAWIAQINSKFCKFSNCFKLISVNGNFITPVYWSDMFQFSIFSNLKNIFPGLFIFNKWEMKLHNWKFMFDKLKRWFIYQRQFKNLWLSWYL